MLNSKIHALGRAIAQHHFCGAFDGVAAVLYETESSLGTHFAAVVQANGDSHILPIMSADDARAAFHALVKGFHARQAAMDSAVRNDASRRGKAAYEASLAVRPNYPDGKPRKAWEALGDAERWSWEREARQ